MGNRAVRAYLKVGYAVFPINPHEDKIEGLKTYRSILDVPDEIDRVSIYQPPGVGLRIIADVAKKGVRTMFCFLPRQRRTLKC